MPRLLQAKLLRALETRSFTRLGGERPISTDVRFISATNQDLESLIDAGSFRRDLFFRLNVVRLCLPPLRLRNEDIPVLIEEQIGNLSQRYGRKVDGVEAGLLSALQRYSWPGNVRELFSFVESSFVMSQSNTICWHELPEHFRDKMTPYRQMPSRERDTLIAALEKTSWNRSKAARVLGCSRMTLYRKMARLQVSPRQRT